MERNRFRWTLLKQALLQRKAKALLIVLAVAMGASVLAALLNLNADLRYRMNRELRDYGPNVILQPDPKMDQPYLNSAILSALAPLKSSGRILDFTPELFIPAQIQGSQTVLVGTDISSLRHLYPAWKWKGNSTSTLVGARLATRLQIQAGQPLQITIAGKDVFLSVSGFVEGGEAEDDEIFVDLRVAQKLNGNSDHFHIVAISALGDIASVEKIFHDFASAHAGVSYQVLRKIAAAETLILDRISKLIVLVISIIFLILFFCVQTTVSAILLSRQSEIALFRILGARRKQIMSGLTLELLTLGMVGGISGFGIGVFMAQVLGKVLFQTFIIPRVSTFLITILFSLIMMVVSSIWPIRRAINRQAALVLKEG